VGRRCRCAETEGGGCRRHCLERDPELNLADRGLRMEIEMKTRSSLWKVLAVALGVLLIAACGGAPSATSPEATEQQPTGIEPSVVPQEPVEATAAPFEVCFMYDGPANDGGYVQSQDEGRQYMEAQLANVVTRYVESVGAGADAERVLTQFAETGCDAIIATSYTYAEATAAVAERYPEIIFENEDTYLLAENIGAYRMRIDQPYYLVGMMFGLLTETNEIGFVAPFPIPQVLRSLNSLTLGARSVNPEATVSVVWTGSWFDPAREREAVDSFVALGADAVGHYTAGPAILGAAQANNVYSHGASADQCFLAPDICVASATYAWGPHYLNIVSSMLDGTWVSQDYWGTMQDGGTAITEYGPFIPDEVAAIVDAKRDEFLAGSTDVFVGPVWDRDGNLRVAEGETLGTNGLISLDWVVEGVIGDIPQ